MDRLYKYTYRGVRVYAVFLQESVEQTKKAHHMSDEDAAYIGECEVLAACLCAMGKEDRFSLALSLKYPQIGKAYAAIAEKDGRIRGYCDAFQGGIIQEGVILDITQKLAVRGDYKSIVTAETLSAAVREFFCTSQQIVAFCHVGRYDDGYACILVEQFPITKPEDEVYRQSAQEEWDYLAPILTAKSISTYLPLFEKYELKQSTPLWFGCTCSKRKVQKSLGGLSNLEDNVQVQCKFCGKNYTFLSDKS